MQQLSSIIVTYIRAVPSRPSHKRLLRTTARVCGSIVVPPTIFLPASHPEYLDKNLNPIAQDLMTIMQPSECNSTEILHRLASRDEKIEEDTLRIGWCLKKFVAWP